MKKYFFLIVLAFNLNFQEMVIAKTIFVAPTGTLTGTGNITKPYDILSVFDGKISLLPGDTVNLRGGVYKGNFEFTGKGTPEKQITVRSYPSETAILQGNLKLHIGCNYVSFIDFEIMGDYSINRKRVSGQLHSKIDDLNTNEGFSVGLNTNIGIKIINLVIHDGCSDGLGLWIKAINTEVYGNIIYNNGWDAKDRGHGHAIYTQNDTGTKRLEDNICFWNLGPGGIHIYTEGSATNNYYLEGNIHFNDNDWFLIGGYKPVKNIQLINNFMGENSRLSIGYTAKLPNSNLIATGNYLQSTNIEKWENLEFKDNKIFGNLNIAMVNHVSEAAYRIESNSYFLPAQISFGGQKMDFPSFNKLGYDTKGSYSASAPTQEQVIIRPNKYEKGRANIIIYNWTKADKVVVNLSAVLKKGDEYEIKDVQHYLGKPVVKGRYTGEPIDIPMNVKEIDTMIGDFTGCYHPDIIKHIHSSVAFGVYVVRKIER